ncbi:hypothetical protein AGMMS50230_21970 [Spirochaetia bacterium]|nr:hypothetical protein AGMMS50230_21970 [Spirochaetia bacterium]
MSKQLYVVNGHYYFLDDETGKLRRVIIQDDAPIPSEDIQSLLALLAKLAEEKNK